ncbi:MAG: hypothetical protein A2W01_07770 [Candidatus Solincola sediminis]|uniref:Cardiolipin synthase N-terminal domain-containing protein n=1 Tax=Candidatus Solincola sediminis TaxID=1797199 RepID=A0A1F2WMI0_9ACTN|nr:MAG: hypothetical protein A2Y75_12055 [Candidatus Solincola sediminis]OFW61574.1 MAG: hypothetical protein A2W01_07770 [Candidatus Solincola sediminis]
MGLESWKLVVMLIPLVVIELGLMIIALVDLTRRTSVRGGNKIVWALVILLISLIGPIVYLLWGREPEVDGTD